MGSLLTGSHLLIGAPRSHGDVDGLHVALLSYGCMSGEHDFIALGHLSQRPAETRGLRRSEGRGTTALTEKLVASLSRKEQEC